jgi:hypothetical protein
MVRQVAAQYPGQVQVFDLDALLCPGGQFESTIDGVQIRDADGVHIVPTVAAGQWLDARILPDVLRIGRLHQQGRTLVDGQVPTATSSTRSHAAPPATAVASPPTG